VEFCTNSLCATIANPHLFFADQKLLHRSYYFWLRLSVQWHSKNKRGIIQFSAFRSSNVVGKRKLLHLARSSNSRLVLIDIGMGQAQYCLQTIMNDERKLNAVEVAKPLEIAKDKRHQRQLRNIEENKNGGRELLAVPMLICGPSSS
jgi:hypothetical protein